MFEFSIIFLESMDINAVLSKTGPSVYECREKDLSKSFKIFIVLKIFWSIKEDTSLM
jgi:hypothetical protein